MYKISIIIPARPGAPISEKTIDAIKYSDYPKEDIEVIVTRGLRPAAQRNMAAKIASGDILYFLDEDAVADKMLFKEALDCYRRRDIAGAGGPVIQFRDSSLLQKAIECIFTSNFGVFKIKARYASCGPLREAGENDLILANFSIKKETFLKEKGFCEKLYPNEENELFHRLLSKKDTLLYNPRAVIYRYHEKNLFSFIKQIFNYGRGRMEQAMIRPSCVCLSRFIPLFFIIYLLTLMKAATPLFFIPVFIYILFIPVFSLRGSLKKKNFLILPILVALYPLTHFCYAAGNLWALAKKPFPRNGFSACDIHIEKIKQFNLGFADEGPVN